MCDVSITRSVEHYVLFHLNVSISLIFNQAA